MTAPTPDTMPAPATGTPRPLPIAANAIALAILLPLTLVWLVGQQPFFYMLTLGGFICAVAGMGSALLVAEMPESAERTWNVASWVFLAAAIVVAAGGSAIYVILNATVLS